MRWPGRRRGVAGAVREFDGRLFGAVARSHTPALDRVLPRLSRAADHAALWVAVAGGSAAIGGRVGKRAAGRGIAAIAITSVVVNVAIKPVVRRPRPAIRRVPAVRRLRAMPLTTSFPSGHAASASAFATGVAIESRGLAAAVTPVAGAVAFSRVYVGVHYPLDVAAGAFLGAAVAWFTRNQFPAVPWEAERSSPSRDHRPQVTDSRGAGLSIVVNSDSGSAVGAPVEGQLQEILPDADVSEPGTDGLQRALESAADGSRAVGVAGGDGTVAAAAGIAADRDLPLMLLATGTLNHLARDAHLDRTDDALAAYREGDAIGVDLATAGESTFINTLTLGAYPRMLELRERLSRYIGRWPAHVAAAAWTLGSCGPVALRIDGEARKILMAYIGNCAHEPVGFAPSWRPRLDDGLLDIRILHAEVPLARLRLIGAILTGTLPRCAAYERRLAPRLKVESDLEELTVARDGDIHTGPGTFEIAKRPRALTLFASAGRRRRG